MKYFGTTQHTEYLRDADALPMARTYWGASPLPKGAEIVGGFSDPRRAGALIKLHNGVYVCGNAGAITNITQPKP